MVCAETEAEAERLAATIDFNYVRRAQGEYRPLVSPEEALAYPYSPAEERARRANRARVFVGTPAVLHERLSAFAEATGADELMITTAIFDHDARKRSYALLADAFGLPAPEPAAMSVLDRFRLDGRRLFITGGSRGLGRAMALALADAGADVVLIGRDAASLERTADEIRALGRTAWPIQADMAIPATCEAACAEALADHGPIDILINNVGGRRDPTPLVDMPLARWQELIDLNLTSTFLCTQADRRRDGRARPGRPRHQHRLDQRAGRRPQDRRPPLRDRQGRGRPAHPRRSPPTGRRPASPSTRSAPASS